MSNTLIDTDPVTVVIPLDSLSEDSLLLGPSPDQAFVDSVRNYGVLLPIIVAQREDGSYIVFSGRRRIKAARSVGLSEITAIVYAEGMVSGEHICIIENRQRSDNHLAEFAAIRALLKNPDNSLEVIARETGLPAHKVRQYEAMLALPSELIDGITSGKVAWGVASRVAKFSPARQQKALEYLSYHGKLTGDHVAEIAQVGAVEAVETLPDFLFEPQAVSHVEPTPSPESQAIASLPDPSNPAGERERFEVLRTEVLILVDRFGQNRPEVARIVARLKRDLCRIDEIMGQETSDV